MTGSTIGSLVASILTDVLANFSSAVGFNQNGVRMGDISSLWYGPNADAMAILSGIIVATKQ